MEWIIFSNILSDHIKKQEKEVQTLPKQAKLRQQDQSIINEIKIENNREN